MYALMGSDRAGLPVYPLGKIPLLKDGDHTVPESSIIIEYLDHSFPDTAQLLPNDKVASRRTRFFDRMNDLYLNDAATTLLFQGWKPEADRAPNKIDTAMRRLNVMYGYMNGHLEGNQWLMGDTFTMADCAAAPALFCARDVLPFAEHEHVDAYWRRLRSRPSYQRVLAEAAPLLEQMAEARAAGA